MLFLVDEGISERILYSLNLKGLTGIGGDLAPSLGDGKNFAAQIFERPFYRKQISILPPKISDDLFLVIDSTLSICFLSLLS